MQKLSDYIRNACVGFEHNPPDSDFQRGYLAALIEITVPGTTWSAPVPEISDAVILGRKIGTNIGWDEADNYAVILYDFKGKIDDEDINADLIVDYERGLLLIYSESGDMERSWDISVITNLPRTEPLE